MTTPYISARAEVILDEVRLDMRELLRCFVGELNTKNIRDEIAGHLTSYMYAIPEVRSAICICDETNNPPCLIDNGELHADLIFVIDDVSYCAAGAVTPGMSNYNPDIDAHITVRKERAQLSFDFQEDDYIEINEDYLQYAPGAVDVEQEIAEVLALDIDEIVGQEQEERHVFYIDIGNATFSSEALRNLVDAIQNTALELKDIPQYDDMPDSLVNALKV